MMSLMLLIFVDDVDIDDVIDVVDAVNGSVNHSLKVVKLRCRTATAHLVIMPDVLMEVMRMM